MSDLNVLVIDDMRIAREPGAVHAETPDKGLELLKSKDWNVVCLDHDLGYDFESGAELTIRPVLDYIVENAHRFKDTLFYVVTSNPYAGDMMTASLDMFGLWNIRLTDTQKDEMFDYRSWEDMTGY